MNYLLAISGGVDSVVLLDMVAKIQEGLVTSRDPTGQPVEHSSTVTSSCELPTGSPHPPLDSELNSESTLHPLKFVLSAHDQVAVCHIDHGIRRDSGDDRRFVAGLAAKYGLEFVTTELHLGPNASEEQARGARYQFLFAEAEKRQATIVTAHHADDLAATVAINLTRGTGWRGLAVLGRSGIERPLLHLRKRDIYRYALAQHLEYVEDSTNADLTILRNRLRGAVFDLDDQTVQRIGELRHEQLALGWLIDREVARLNRQFAGRRYPYLQIAPAVAVELLRQLVGVVALERPTRTEAERLLVAIKTAQPETTLELSRGVRAHFGRQRFVVER